MRISRLLGDPYRRDNACRRHGQVVCQHVRLTIWWPESSSDHQLNLFPASLRMKSLVMLINSHLAASYQLFCFVLFFKSVLFYLDYMLKNYLSGVPVIYQTTNSPPFFLRDSRASKTRAGVKITHARKGDTRRGERKISLSPPRDYSQSSDLLSWST